MFVYLFILLFLYVCVCVCVCVRARVYVCALFFPFFTLRSTGGGGHGPIVPPSYVSARIRYYSISYFSLNLQNKQANTQTNINM